MICGFNVILQCNNNQKKKYLKQGLQNMGRRTFLRNSLPTAGGVLLGGSAISRFLKDGKMEGPPRPTAIETICRGNGKMSSH